MQATDPGVNAVPIRCFEQAKHIAAGWQNTVHRFRPGYLYGVCCCLLLQAAGHELFCTLTAVLEQSVLAEGLPILVKDLTAVQGLPFTLVSTPICC